MLCSQPQSSVKGQPSTTSNHIKNVFGCLWSDCSCCCFSLVASRCCFCCLFSDVCLLFEINSQLEGSLSQWTSYQEDSRQFVAWMERVEESLDPAEKQCPEMRDKTANLSKAKVRQYSQSYCVLSSRADDL